MKFGHYTINDQISNQKPATKANKSPKKANPSMRNPATTAQNPHMPRGDHFPIQNFENIKSNKSSLLTSPVISPK